jgi:hypothetical protein
VASVIDGAALDFWAARIGVASALVMFGALVLLVVVWRRDVRQLRAQLQCARTEARAARNVLAAGRRGPSTPAYRLPTDKAVRAAGWLPMTYVARRRETRQLERMYAQPNQEPPTQIGAEQ